MATNISQLLQESKKKHTAMMNNGCRYNVSLSMFNKY